MSDKPSHPQKPDYIKDLALLFAIPLAIVIFAAAIIYIPRLMANPRYDFVYCAEYRCGSAYSVDSQGYLIGRNLNDKSNRNLSYDEYQESRLNDARYSSLRYYDADSDSTKAISLEEAKQYKLNTSSKSADGYILKRETSSSGFLFWGDYEDGWYLQDGAKKKKIELSSNDSYYSSDVKFLGWVEE